MGQIVSRILGFLFGINGNNKEKLPDLEEGPGSQTDHSQAILLPAASSSSSSSSSQSYNWLQYQQDGENGPDDDEVGEEELTADRQSITLIHRLPYLPPASTFSMITNDDEGEEVVPVRAPTPPTRMPDPEVRWIKHYSSNQKILLVGEGDFSFSSCLASAFVSASNIIATSLDSQEFLRKNYRKAISNIQNLKNRRAMVKHEVNVRKMANYSWLKDLKFDRIIYNFPLAGFFPDESRDSNLRRNRKLVAMFLNNARKLLHEDGEIHITHKCNGFFLEWNIKSLGSNYGLRLLEEVPFHRRDYPRYSTKYGFGGDDAFDCNPSKTYKFALNQL